VVRGEGSLLQLCERDHGRPAPLRGAAHHGQARGSHRVHPPPPQGGGGALRTAGRPQDGRLGAVLGEPRGTREARPARSQAGRRRDRCAEQVGARERLSPLPPGLRDPGQVRKHRVARRLVVVGKAGARPQLPRGCGGGDETGHPVLQAGDRREASEWGRGDVRGGDEGGFQAPSGHPL